MSTYSDNVQCSYGTWAQHFGGTTTDSDVDREIALGEYAGDFDINAINREFREAVNAALPDGVALVGDEFYGPANSYDELVPLIDPAVESVDFWEIVQKHDTSGSAA